MGLPEIELRDAAMRWLDASPSPLVDFQWLAAFEFDGIQTFRFLVRPSL